MAFGHHISNAGTLRGCEVHGTVLAGPVLAGADGATKAAGLLETDSAFLVVDRARPVFNHCLFFLVRGARYRPISITDFAMGTLILH